MTTKKPPTAEVRLAFGDVDDDGEVDVSIQASVFGREVLKYVGDIPDSAATSFLDVGHAVAARILRRFLGKKQISS